jgi:hypothetical protein
MESESYMAKYMQSRTAFRQKAISDFAAADPTAVSLVRMTGDYVAWFTLSLSGRDFRLVQHGFHVSPLVVSFARTHFIVSDLVLCCELVEAATLLRKQFELLVRLNELGQGDPKKLQGKVPNLKALRTNLRMLYGQYSEIAHSASTQPLEIMGTLHETEGTRRTPVYPIYDPHAKVTACHLAGTATEFAIWCDAFLTEHGKALGVAAEPERTLGLANAYVAYTRRLEDEGGA